MLFSRRQHCGPPKEPHSEEVIPNGCQEEGEEGHEEEGCEEEEVRILDLARPQGIGRRPVGQSPFSETSATQEAWRGGKRSGNGDALAASDGRTNRRPNVERP
jgi:hypothetical protein